MSALSSIKAENSTLDARSPSSLLEQGIEALSKEDSVTAGRVFTIAIDLLLDNKDPATLIHPAGILSAIDVKSGGILHKLFSQRSIAMLKQTDYLAAKSDAELCTLTKPDYDRGHLNLLKALDSDGSSVEERRSVCSKALLSCPNCDELKSLELRYALSKDENKAPTGSAEVDQLAIMGATLKIANEKDHPQRGMACGDVGSAYANGAFGLEKDLLKAEIYLKTGMRLHDAPSARNLGLLFLANNRIGEALPVLSTAVQMGDSDAREILESVVSEAKQKEMEMLEKLRGFAKMGDEKAIKLLSEFEANQSTST